MDIVKQYALSFVGAKYLWGGDDPLGGFDCSGYVSEILTAFGVLPHGIGKLNAQMIYDRLEANSSVNTWGLGSIAIFGKDIKNISHIGFCLDQYLMVEAGGGASDTVDDATAIKRNAFVRIRPIKYRKDFILVLKPKYATIGII